MLPTNFAPLAEAEPELRDAFYLLEGWIKSHLDRKWIDPTWVARDLPLLDVFQLSRALNIAVTRGVLVIRYTVLTPSGVLAGDLFKSPSDIPDVLPDRFENYFNTTDLPIIPVFLESTNIPAHSSASMEYSE